MNPVNLNLITGRHIGFVSTRFHGTDGVSLETRKWGTLLEQLGHSCFWMAGLLDTPAEKSHLVPLAFFNHPEILEVQSWLFGTDIRPRSVSNQVQQIKEQLKEQIYQFIQRFRIELLIPQNILALPMHVPLGLAMTEVMAETGLPAVAHHHDFAWERERFWISSCNDYLQASFPAVLPRIQHVVINSAAQAELARRFGVASTVIPNIVDFETPAPGIDNYNRDFREEIGLDKNDVLILQPTRIVARKGIEHSIELLRRLNHPRAVLVFSHPAGDEGKSYMALLQEQISDARIQARFIADRVTEVRTTVNGKKTFTLFDVYPHADLVAYPSLYEGFGNAFLEAIYFRKPVFVNRYSVWLRDIGPLGFKVIEMTQLITNEVIERTRDVLENSALRQEWAEINYQLGLKYFSYSMARRKLAARIANLFGEGV